MELIILAAGRGSRLPKKYRKLPKCLVKIKSKELIFYNYNFINKFKKKYVVCGYKKEILKKKIKSLKCKYVYNKNYKSTNMVHSLSLVANKIKTDVVIMYGDIIFDEKIYSKLKKNKNIIPLNSKWLINWKKRMGMKKTLIDAEDVKIKKNIVEEIGKPLNYNDLPKFQFMGLLKLKIKTFRQMIMFYKKLNNKKVDMTTFLNLCIKKKRLRLEVANSKLSWYEIDTIEDYNYAKKQIKKW